MATFLNDTFTDTAGVALTAHAGETGAAWTQHPATLLSAAAVISATNTVRPTVTGGSNASGAFASGVPLGPNYTVTATLDVKTLRSGDYVGVLARVSTTTDNMYTALYIHGTGYVLGRRLNGTYSNLAAAYVATAATGDTLALDVAGTTVRLLVNGTQRASVTDATIAGPGRAGVYFYATSAPGDAVGIHLTGVTAVDTGLTVAVSDANLAAGLTPFNWYTSGSAYVQSNNPGARLRCGFTGTSCSVLVDVSPLSGEAANVYPFVAWSVDGGAWSVVQLTSTTVSVLVAVGLAARTHQLTFVFDFISPYVTDKWTTPKGVVRVIGLAIDPSAATAAPTGIPTDKAVFFGDSITEARFDTSTFLTGSHLDTLSPALGAALNCDVGVVAFSGSGWTTASGTVPAFLSHYGLYFTGQSRLVSGLLSPAPKYVVVNHGRNGSPVQASVQTVLGSLRTAAPNATILVVVPYAGTNRATIVAAVAAVGDANTKVIDLATDADFGGSAATANTVDGTHPTARWYTSGAGLLGSGVQRALQPALGWALTGRG